MASSVMVSSAAVLRAAPAQASMVTPFTRIKSTSAFPVTRMANADLSKLPSNGGRVHCMQEPRSISSLQPASQERRSANYHPTIWNHHVIESICSPYSDTAFRSRIEELKLETRQLLMELNTSLLKLEFVNSRYLLNS